MSKHNIFEFKDRDTISDALTQMLRTGANQLIHQAVQIELEELLTAKAHRFNTRWKCRGCAQWLPAPARDTDRHWTGDREITQGEIKGRRGRLFSFCPGTAVCS